MAISDRWSKLVALLTGLGITLLSVAYIFDPFLGMDLAQAGYTPQQIQIIQQVLEIGPGLYLTALGGVLMTIGAGAGISTDRPVDIESTQSDTESKPETDGPESIESNETLELVIRVLKADEVVTDTELKKKVYTISPRGFQDSDAWWDEVSEEMEEHEMIEKLDSTGRRWTIADE